ncbi:MAG TPA: right-handed parallel beta-helix repeat-containing protein, partial [Egicoccus sp.]
MLATGIPGVALAADTTVVVDENDASWFFSSDHLDEAGELVTETTGTGGIATAPVALPGYGTDAYRLQIPDTQKARAMTNLLNGQPLSALSSVTYSVYKSGLPGYAPAVNVIIDPALPLQTYTGTPPVAAGAPVDDDYVSLVWEANKAGLTIAEDTWQTWTTGTTDGWWTPSLPNTVVPGGNNNPLTLEEMKALFGPTSTIIGFAINMGRHPAMTAYVDGVGITLGADTTTYDFELAPPPPPAHCPEGATLVAPGTGLQAAVNTAADGATLCLEAGTYTLSSSLNLDAPVTIVGAGSGATTIDASGVSGYGLDWSANDVTLEGVTVLGPTANAGSSYGVKIAPPGDTPLSGATLRDVRVTGSGRTEVDLHNVTASTLEDVVADGQGTAGVGIALTNSTNISVSGVDSSGNTWGAMTLYTHDSDYTSVGDSLGVPAVSDITISESTFGAGGVFGLYLQDTGETCEQEGCAFSNIAVTNSTFNGSPVQVGQVDSNANQQAALDLGLDIDAILTTSGNTFDRAITARDRAGALVVQAIFGAIQPAITAAAAAGGAIIDVPAGVYDESLQIPAVSDGITVRGPEIDGAIGGGNQPTAVLRPTTAAEATYRAIAVTAPSAGPAGGVLLENLLVDLSEIGALSTTTMHGIWADAGLAGASLGVSKVRVANVRKALDSQFGFQTGRAIEIGAPAGTLAAGQGVTVEVVDSVIDNFQKSGIIVRAGDGEVDLSVLRTTISGVSPVPNTQMSQNGVTFIGGGQLSIVDSVIENIGPASSTNNADEGGAKIASDGTVGYAVLGTPTDPVADTVVTGTTFRNVQGIITPYIGTR